MIVLVVINEQEVAVFITILLLIATHKVRETICVLVRKLRPM